MKVSISWLKELVDLKVSVEELISLLPLRTIGLKDVTPETIELDMKGYNRADLLSMRGVAYEVGAITNSLVTFPDEEPKVNEENLSKLNISIEDINLCPIYCLVKIEGLKVSPSSGDWQQKLISSGLRPVNNIADVTNLVMLEYGQPMHAFDVSQVKDETIVVRTAKDGEIIETLDGKRRELMPTDLLITDPEKAIGIAGVMGGKNSEVTDSTSTILLEAAIFDPKALRKTATRLGLQSEASKRFYHGLTKRRLLQSLEAAVKMYEGLGGKMTALTTSGEYKTTHKPINLNYEKVKSLIGIEINKSQVVEYLTKLHFSVNEISDSEWEVTAPYWRIDIEFPEDLIEEVARMYGYEKIPAKELIGENPAKIDQSKFDRNFSIKNTLADLGLTEIQTYSFFSNDVLENLQLEQSSLIKLANPISSETEYLRNSLWPNVLETVIKNQKQNFSDIAIFEVGKIYDISDTGQPIENYHLSIGLMNKTDNPTEELSNIFKQLDTKLNLGIEMGQRNETNVPENLFHPNRFINLLKNGQAIGKIAEVHPRIVNRFGIDKRIAILEIEI